jgi:predicted dehydrogenase
LNAPFCPPPLGAICNSKEIPSMTEKPEATNKTSSSRRDFIKASSMLVAGGAVSGSLSIARAAHAFGSDTIKIGLVGCGGRGTGAAAQALNTMKKTDINPNGEVKLIAMADAFGDRLQASIRTIKGQHGNYFDVPKDRQFVGFDAYKHVLECDIDLVLLATPPGFRPMHFEAAVNAGKNVFMEKPVATDALGVRRVLEANEKAKAKNLAVAVGLQRHHEKRYLECVQRIWDGAIGDIVATRVYWNGAGVWTRPRQANQTELEYQMRNWYYFNWLCGDHITEQHIHNLDVSNWLLQGYPIECNGMGGREVRTSREHGQIFDHHFCEFTYENGVKMFSQCRHIKGCWNNVSEHVHGTKGSADLSGKIYDAKGDLVWSYGRGGGGGHQEEHYDLFAALRRGETPNEGDYGAKSTMTSILGRMANYCGKSIKWADAIDSKITLADFDSFTSYEDEAPVKPDENGYYPVPVPGEEAVV